MTQTSNDNDAKPASSSAKTRLVIIGAGMASGRLIEHLLEREPDTFEITLFNAEARGNYNRIMLSPVLSGEKTYENCQFQVGEPKHRYAKKRINSWLTGLGFPILRSTPRDNASHSDGNQTTELLSLKNKQKNRQIFIPKVPEEPISGKKAKI